MPLSGTISKKITGREYRIEWSAKQSVENNTSTITCVHKLINAAGYGLDIYGRENTCTVGSDKKIFNSAGITTSGGSTITLGTTTHTIKHDDNGAKTVTITGVFNIQATLSGSYLSSITATGTVTLNTIPRTSTVTATNANIGSKTTITINRAATSFTHTLTYSYNGLTGTIATKTTSTSIAWTVPTSFYAKTPKKTGTCTITCTTYNGATSMGSTSCTFTVTAAEADCKPTVSVTAVDTNANTIALTGSNKKIVKGFSNVRVTTTATAKNSATISSVSVTCGSDTKSGTDVTFSGASSSTIKAVATDSREWSNTATASGLTLIDYIAPTIIDTVSRESPTSATVNVSVKGNYFNGNFGAVANTLKLEVRYKPKSQANYTDANAFVTMPAQISGNAYTASVTLTGLEYTEAYDIQIRLIDGIHTTSGAVAAPVYRNTGISKGIPVFDWGENDFRFNVPIYSGGVNFTQIYQAESGAAGLGQGESTTIKNPTDNHRLYYVRPTVSDGVSPANVYIPCARLGNMITGIGGYPHASGRIDIFCVYLTLSGDKVTVTYCGYWNTAEQSYAQRKVNGIFAVL